MFLGHFHQKLGGRNRITLPKQFHVKLQEPQLGMFKGAGKKVSFFPMEVFRNIYKRFSSLDEFNPEHRLLQLSVFQSMQVVSVDRRGRFYVPRNILNYAQIDSEIALIGLVNRFELWNPSVLKREFKNGFSDMITDNTQLEKYFKNDPSYLINFLRANYLKSESTRIKDYQMKSNLLFLCHSKKDAPFVKTLAQDLIKRGVSVWFDELEMLPGDSLIDKIQKGIENSSWFGIVLSPNSVNSKWCKKELNTALAKELKKRNVFVIPILHEACRIPNFLEEKFYVDMTSGKYDEGLDLLLKRFK